MEMFQADESRHTDEVSRAVVRCGDSLTLMADLPESSVALIVADPPYHKVKMGEAWDRQWKTDADYLAWIGRLCEQWRRVLRANGSLYVFASPRMAARVEVEVGKWFNVLNGIVWTKSDETTHALKYGDDRFRQYVQKSERIIFAEQYSADSMARGEAGYEAKCDELRGFVFEPLRAYLDGERKRAGVRHREVIAYLGMGGHDTHFFSPIQWKLPLPDQYEAMRSLFNGPSGGDYLRREYEDLRREYEDLRRQYEDLRRPFSVSADVHYTDVWDFPTVKPYPGKHPCEKPPALCQHVISASSRHDDLVLDPFCGSGVVGEAALRLGRRFTGFDQDPRWVERTRRRIEIEAVDLPAGLPVSLPMRGPTAGRTAGSAGPRQATLAGF